MIKIKNLNKIYNSSKSTVHAIKDISLEVDKGDIFGIVGLSGAGKSTLIRCINRLEEPTSGEITINDVNILKLNQKELKETRKNIGMIFQHFNLLNSRTVGQNIAFPLEINKTNKELISKRVDELLELVDLKDKKDRYPAQLSGGQKQRVGIARALATNPNLLLCDEATSALDPITTKSILALLKSINQKLGLTIILITHQMEVIKEICNKVAVIEHGVIVEQGLTTEVFSNPSHPTTKFFVSEIHHELPEQLLKSTSDKGTLIKLSFVGEYTKEPIISELIKKFNIDANILMGSIDSIQDSIVGNLVLSLNGAESDIENSLKYLDERNVKVEVIN